MGFFSRHRKAFRSVIASFGMLFGLLAGVSVTANVGYAALNSSLSQLLEPSEKGKGTWRTSNDSISGEVTGNRVLGVDYKHDATFSLRNISGKAIELSFDWSATIPSSKGKVIVDGASYTTSQNSVTKKIDRLEANSVVSIKLEATGKNTTKIQISKIAAVVITESAVTFKKANFGHYYVNDVLVDDGFQQPGVKPSTTTYTLKAKADVGYQFIGWQITVAGESKIISFENPLDFKSADDCDVTAIFKKGQNLAIFRNDSRYFGDLNEAISHAKEKTNSDKTIVAVKDGTVASGNYTLDSGLSLLIPNEDGATLSQYATEDPNYVKNTASQCVLFRKISFLSGANLDVYGQVVVCCTPAFKTVSSNEFNNHTAIPSGAYGQIDMQQGSTIVLQNGAKLFAWGFVTGEGLIEARSGAIVYELFQISSWRGGSVAKDMNKNKEKVFIINQYYVQNIECELKIWAGATEKTLTGMYMSLKDLVEATPHPCFVFIGDGGMFKMSSGYLKKQYWPAEDRLMISVNGDGLLSSIAFDLDALGFAIRLDAKDYVLPINNNISISIQTGSSCSVNQDLGFLPGSELIVEQGASFEVQSGHNLTFYDLDNWGNYATEAKLRPVKYSPTRTKTRTEADLTDAKLALGGTLTVGSGSYLMTTGKNTDVNIGAQIISPGRTGVIKFTDKSATTCPAVYQYYGKNSKVSENYVLIDATFAKLQNGDHSYTQSAPGNTYHYDKVLDRWSLSTEHATKSGLFKTIDNNGVIKTVLLENDVMATGRTGLFHYSSTNTNYKTGDNHYYYLQSGVVVSNKKWYQENGKWYFFGSNQYAYQGMSAVFTASTGITGFGIQARYFFNDAATVERLVTVNNVVGLSQDITIITIDTVKYCYYKSIKAGVGLFEKQSGSNYSVYLAKDDGSLMTNGTYYVPSHKINNIKDSSGKVLTAGLYYFDKNGHMYDSNFKEITRGTAS